MNLNTFLKQKSIKKEFTKNNCICFSINSLVATNPNPLH